MSELSVSHSLAERILQGDKRALARLLTRIENNDASAESILSELYANVGRAYRIGMTGPPGRRQKHPYQQAYPPFATGW
jgi:Putative periplasmic protein kinase ArgK and related GTPases of G3E family